MKKIGNLRAAFLKKNGEWVYYPIKIGDSHREIIEDFAKKELIDYPSSDTICDAGNVIFYNANDGVVISYLPTCVTDEQLYQLDLFTSYMDDIVYMEAKKGNEEFIFMDDITTKFSNEVIQSYFTKKKR